MMKDLTEKNSHQSIVQGFKNNQPTGANQATILTDFPYHEQPPNDSQSTLAAFNTQQKKKQEFQAVPQSIQQASNQYGNEYLKNSQQFTQHKITENTILFSEQSSTPNTQQFNQTKYNPWQLSFSLQKGQNRQNLSTDQMDIQQIQSANSNSFELSAHQLNNSKLQQSDKQDKQQNNQNEQSMANSLKRQDIANQKSANYFTKDPLQLYPNRLKSFHIQQRYETASQNIINRSYQFVDFQPLPRKYSYLPFHNLVSALPEIGQAINFKDIKQDLNRYFQQQGLLQNQTNLLDIKLQESQYFINQKSTSECEKMAKLQQNIDQKNFLVLKTQYQDNNDRNYANYKQFQEIPRNSEIQHVFDIEKKKEQAMRKNQTVNPTIKIVIKKPKQTKSKSPFKMLNKTEASLEKCNLNYQQYKEQKAYFSPSQIPDIGKFFNPKVITTHVYPSEPSPEFFHDKVPQIARQTVEKIQNLEKCHLKLYQTPKQSIVKDNLCCNSNQKKKKIQLTPATINNGSNINRIQTEVSRSKVLKKKQENQTSRKIKISKLQSQSLQKKIQQFCSNAPVIEENTIRKPARFKKHRMSDINVFLHSSPHSLSNSKAKGIFRSNEKRQQISHQFHKLNEEKHLSDKQTIRSSLKTLQRFSYNPSYKKSTVRKGVSHSNLFQESNCRTNKTNHNKSASNYEQLQNQLDRPYLKIGKATMKY